MPTMLSVAAEETIRDEYARLCVRLAMPPVPLDIFICDDEASADERTQLGSVVRVCDARYGGTPRILAVPLCKGDDEPRAIAGWPPPDWDKQGLLWPAWRIDLWHEVVHQYSDLVSGGWDPKEPAIMRPDGRPTSEGHGAAWSRALAAVATEFSCGLPELDRLLDR